MINKITFQEMYNEVHYLSPEEKGSKFITLQSKLNAGKKSPVYCQTNGRTYNSIQEAINDTGETKYMIRKSLDRKTITKNGFLFRRCK